MFVGGASAYAVSVAMSSEENFSSVQTSQSEVAEDLHFTMSEQGASLPDFTSAAQKGVEAVVGVEILKRQQSYNRGGSQGGIDPFEFFFGPQYRRGQPQNQGQGGSDGELQKMGGGSGVLISDDGYIVTNNHVINEADEIKVTLNSGDSYTAELVGTDPSTDIALLKINGKKPFKYLTFGDAEKLKVGEWVLAVGNPFGLSSTVTSGIISAKGRSLGASRGQQMGIESFIQTDAAVNPGNSGGALITIDGSLIGINTLIKSPTGSFTGYSFAVPSTIARKIVTDIRQYGVVQRALLGISMSDITDEWIEKIGKDKGVTKREGIFVAGVSKGGAAESVGIKEGDVLLEINGEKMNTSSQVQEAITAYRPGDKIKISVKRDGKVKHFDVTLRNKSGKEELVSSNEVDVVKELGAELVEVSDRVKRELEIRGGLQVIGVQSGGILAKSKVKVGFVITAINDITINSQSDLSKVEGAITSISGIYPNGRMVEYRTL